MVKLFEMKSKIADSDSTVLITGETGTGKEVIAKAIHYGGKRAEKLFNIVDCASINPNLIESELFGHIKGAFTGAISDKEGLLKASEEGTLFLDEIGEIPIFIQVKLLRAIEERIIRPVGSINPQKFNARIIAATSRNLEAAIKNGDFREDLFFRLNVVSLKIPPLRDRKDDIPLLIKHFIKKFDDNRNIINGVSDKVKQILMEYSWPGNVRELLNLIERAFALGCKGKIEIQDLPESVFTNNEEYSTKIDEGNFTLNDHEKEIIIKTLKKTKGKKREAAKRLNIGITTLYRKLKKYEID